MKEWKQRIPGCNNPLWAMMAVSGQTQEQILSPEKMPFIQNLNEAAGLIRKHIEAGDAVKVIGDYDADGVCSSAILSMALANEISRVKGKQMSAEECMKEGLLSVRLPRRFTDGYGMNERMLEGMTGGLLITVDNGISAKKPIENARARGIDTVVLDHHPVTDEELRPAPTVMVDPCAENPVTSAFTGYCGAGLAYRMALELGVSEELRKKLVILASVATITDVMTLTGDNRNIVREGMQLASGRCGTTGFNMLLDSLRCETVAEDTYGFSVGPVLNAAGRLQDRGAEKALVVLLADYKEEERLPRLQEKINELKDLNEIRKSLTESIISQLPSYEGQRPVVAVIPKICVDRALTKIDPEMRIRCCVDGKALEGIVGIVAGKLSEQYRTPAICLSETEDPNVLKGSGRSYGDFNLKKAVSFCRTLFKRVGGHPGAIGCQVAPSNVEQLKKRLSEYLENHPLATEDANTETYDIEINIADITQASNDMSVLGPFGEGMPKPVFLIRNFFLTSRPGSRDSYLLMGEGGRSILFYGPKCQATAFGRTNEWQDMGCPACMDVLVTLSRSFHNGYAYNKANIIDFRPAASLRAGKA